MALPGFIPSGAGFGLAITAATISILIGGIVFGAGIGLGIRRLRITGLEELGQGIISAAMVGAFLAFCVLLDTSVAGLVPDSQLPACPGIAAPSSSPYSFYACHLSFLELSFRALSSSLYRSADIAGFASSLEVSLGAVSAQPFFALESSSRSLSGMAFTAQERAGLAYFELELALAIRDSALAVFLPAGLILRTFFATRKLGAAAMAIAIAAYAIYPLLFLYTFSISKTGVAAAEAHAASDSFNREFSSLPLLDLDATSAVRDAINGMSQGDFGGRAQAIFPTASRANALSVADLALYRFLSAPIFLPYFQAV